MFIFPDFFDISALYVDAIDLSSDMSIILHFIDTFPECVDGADM